MEPTIGRTVHYRLSAADVVRVNRDRSAVPAFAGNDPHKGDVVPLVVVKVWPGEYECSAPGEWVDETWHPFELLSTTGINGQAVLDGNHCVWICSASHGDGPGQWNWSPIDA